MLFWFFVCQDFCICFFFFVGGGGWSKSQLNSKEILNSTLSSVIGCCWAVGWVLYCSLYVVVRYIYIYYEHILYVDCRFHICENHDMTWPLVQMQLCLFGGSTGPINQGAHQRFGSPSRTHGCATLHGAFRTSDFGLICRAAKPDREALWSFCRKIPCLGENVNWPSSNLPI